jgi:hypothetical protein
MVHQHFSSWASVMKNKHLAESLRLGTVVAISVVEVISMSNYVASEKLAYSVEELSELSTLSAPKIRKDIRNGKLASKKKGSRRIILRDEALRYLNADETVILNEPDFSFS